MWEIKRSNLLPVLEILQMVPEKLGVPSSQYFWLHGKGNKLTISVASYISGEVTVEGIGTWPIEKDFYVDRQVFLPFITIAKELKDKHTFQFNRHKKQLVLTHGSRKAVFDSQSTVKGYGNVKKLSTHKHSSIPISEDMKEMLACGKDCAVSDSVTPHLNCVYVTKSSTTHVSSYASSDKVYYLGVGKLDDGRIKASIPFPLMLIDLLAVKGLKKISWVDKYIVLKFHNGMIWQPVSEDALKSFPLHSIQKHIKKADKLPVTFTSSSRRFTRLMVRLGFYLQGVRRKDWVVNISGKKSASHVMLDTSIPGTSFTEKISTNEVLKKDFNIPLPLDTLVPVFEFLSKKTKKIGLVVRIDTKHGVSYVRTGRFWFAITSKQEG